MLETGQYLEDQASGHTDRLQVTSGDLRLDLLTIRGRQIREISSEALDLSSFVRVKMVFFVSLQPECLFLTTSYIFKC